ncbi:hypothetical protein HYC85_020009 [Camellia sinensis]|uniref:Uncharacterized protein n=1 Tax=Camellia sinensis TaxID=4442 RepID=A0A7J7GPF8_CAMSI|nr:hypothetical protein HYC85_020009 [Camellia sinensis]
MLIQNRPNSFVEKKLPYQPSEFFKLFILSLPRTTPHTHLIVDSPARLCSTKSLLLRHRSRLCRFFDQASAALREWIVLVAFCILTLSSQSQCLNADFPLLFSSCLDIQISELLPLQKNFKDLKAQMELKAEQNEHHKLCELVKRIEQELLEAKSAASEKQLLYDECITTVSLLKKSICENTNNRDVRLKDLEKKIKAIKAQVQSASKDLKGHANEKERLLMEMEAVKQECASLESQSVSLRQQINSLTSEIASIRNAHDQAQSELNLFCSKIKECDTQISCILREQQELQHKISETNLERKKMENEVKRMEMEQKSCSLKVEKIIEKHAWITLEKHRFGRSGTDYDFASCDPHTAREDFEKLQVEQSGLEKRVNKKAMAMFEKSEDEYNDLISKKNVIENDKTKIKMVIEELDEKKKEMLKVTLVKVNNDFGSIFSTLLPGTMAKLETPEGSTFLEGLEVCVAFGNKHASSIIVSTDILPNHHALSTTITTILHR